MINLHIQYYITNNADRQRELDKCLSINLSNTMIDRVFIYLDKETREKLDYFKDMWHNPKIVIIDTEERLSFAIGFRYFQPNAWNILANSDIYFDNSLECLPEQPDPSRVYCLTRYELPEKKLNELSHCCQDSWIHWGKFSSDVILQLKDIHLGVIGCDNRVTHILAINGYFPTNAALSIKSFHIHQGYKKVYGSNGRLYGNYLFLPVSTINEPKIPEGIYAYQSRPVEYYSGSVEDFCDFYRKHSKTHDIKKSN